MTGGTTHLTFGDTISISAAPDDVERVSRFIGFLGADDRAVMLERSTARLQLLATLPDIPKLDEESPLYYDVIIWNALKKVVMQ